MGTTFQYIAGFTLLAALSAAAVAFVLYEPAVLGLALAVGAAMGWCSWLDRQVR